MDMENELEEFKKHHRPALVGASLRDLEEESVSPSRSSSKPVVKNRESRSHYVTLADLKAEGGLVDDGEGELDSIMDGSGHIKDEVLPDDVKLKTEKAPSVSHSLNIDDSKAKGSDKNEMNVYGGHGDEFVVPASGKASGYNHSTKKKKKIGKGTPENQDEDHDIISAEKVKSVNDILEEVSTGEFDEKKKRDASLLDSKLSKMMNDLKELNFDTIDDSEDHPDDEMLPPAARRKGSRSQSRASSLAPTESRGRSLARENSGVFQPHLARGDSYHSGLNEENFHHPISSTPSFVNLERQPRHDPNHGQKYFNSSSLNYLRSISRSRSRAANDRKALGENVSLEELKNSGALTNDSEDPSSNGPNFEDAIEKALKHVDTTSNIKSVRSSDVLSNLEDVKEEEDNASCRAMNNDTMLDQLANSAKELMLNDDSDDKKKETAVKYESNKEDLGDKLKGASNRFTHSVDDKMKSTDTAESLDEKQLLGEENDKATANQAQIFISKEATDQNLTRNEKATDRSTDKNSDLNENLKINKTKNVEEEKEEKQEQEQNQEKEQEDERVEEQERESREIKETQEREEEKEEEDNSDENLDDDEHEEPLRIPSLSNDEDTSVAVKSTGTPEAPIATNISFVDKTDDANQRPKHNVSDGVKEDSKEGKVDHESESGSELASGSVKEEPEKEVDEDDIEALIAEAMKEHSSKGRFYDKTDELSVLVAGAVKEQRDIRDDAEFDALVAAARKEKESQLASKSNAENAENANNGSVFVPKAAKMEFEDEPVYLYTSLAGGFHVHNRTQRVITILTVNKIAYTVRDLGTDEEAKSIWRRYCGGKTLPGIVRGKDDFIGNWEDVEEANENYAIRSLIFETY